MTKPKEMSTFTEKDARTILEMMEVCLNEGIGPDWDAMLAEILEQHPSLAEEFAGRAF